MRIGVEVAVAHDLLHVDLDEEREELLSVDACGAKAFDIRDLDAVDVLHREDALSRVFANDAGDDDVVTVGEGRSDGAHGLGFVQHVDFERHVGGELLVDRLEGIVADAGFEPDKAAEDAEVGLDEARAVRVDDFDGDLAAVLQLRLVDLGEGRCSNGLRVEFGEDGVDWAAELALDVGLHLLPGVWRDLVLEAGKDGGVFLGEDIGAAADGLADLDHEALKPQNASVNAFGTAAVMIAQALFVLCRRHPVLAQGEQLVAGEDTCRGGGGVCEAKDSVLA